MFQFRANGAKDTRTQKCNIGIAAIAKQQFSEQMGGQITWVELEFC